MHPAATEDDIRAEINEAGERARWVNVARVLADDNLMAAGVVHPGALARFCPRGGWLFGRVNDVPFLEMVVVDIPQTVVIVQTAGLTTRRLTRFWCGPRDVDVLWDPDGPAAVVTEIETEET